MALHNEIEFEKEICDHLASHGYNTKKASLMTAPQVAQVRGSVLWLEDSQEEVWQTYRQKNGSKAEAQLLKGFAISSNNSNP